MGLQQTIQQLVDQVFAGMEAKFQGRPLILAFIRNVQARVDAVLPALVNQELTKAAQLVQATIDAEFAKLEASAINNHVPFLPDLLRTINVWLDQELQNLVASQAASANTPTNKE